MVETTAPRKLMVIAVDVNDGTIKLPNPDDLHPRVVGMSATVFDNFIEQLEKEGNVDRPYTADENKHPYKTTNPNSPPKHVGVILHTHSSPGCTWMIINGWPFCIG
jgi:hypothetical protein